MVQFASALVDLSHSIHIQFRTAIERIETIDFLFDIGPVRAVSWVFMVGECERERERNLQLGVDESTAQPSLDDAHDQILISLQQVFRITGRDVTPIFFSGGLFALCWRDVDAAELGADDGRSGYVFTADISSNGIDKNVVVAFLVDDALDGCASLCQRGRFGVVVERGEICDDVFPAAIIVDASSGVQSSAKDQSGSWIKLVNAYLVM